MSNIFSTEVLLDGTGTAATARKRWEQAAESSARSMKIKGRPLFLHGSKNGKLTLHYHSCYGRDLCDTMFTGEIFEYDDAQCQISGKITASASARRFAFLLFALAAPLAYLFNEIVYAVSKNFPYLPFMSEEFAYNEVLIFAGAFAVVAAAGVFCFCVDKRKTDTVMEYLHEFIKQDDNIMED